ncbi:MAG: fused MFS/spermidine synthase [Vicinamibacterales bacterium]
MVFAPAAALGATFPMAVRWCAHRSSNPAGVSSALYSMNTVGAAVGSLLAGFTLIPSIGISGTTHIGMFASVLAAALVGIIAWRTSSSDDGARVETSKPSDARPAAAPKTRKREAAREDAPAVSYAPWLASTVLGLSGFAALVHEIVWTRILALVLGPTTYAFAATLAAVVAGVALGSGVGAWLLGRLAPGRRAGALALTLTLGALTIVGTSALAGGYVPATIARQVAAAPDSFIALLRQGMLLTASLILPTAICLGAAFPLALSLAGDPAHSPARRFGIVYAVNTVGSVSGTLAAGFFLIPRLGLPSTLSVGAFVLVVAAVLLVAAVETSTRQRAVAYSLSAVAMLAMIVAPQWDRELLASGVYLYAPFVPKGLDLETQLKAGTLLYYKDGAPATVSVKRLTGTTTLAVDGKTDASNRSDMLTQKLVAHIPLLLHPSPKNVAIVGLGSGVTLGAALSHPIERADVVEISPEVVEASSFFDAENHKALSDPRTHLIVGDGRSHLLLSTSQYDVIISEPSNPWIAGVASLFTREFFEGARARLAPGGIICQWAHTYTISERDLRSIVATFTSVFPNGTAWMVNDNDVLMVASLDPVVPMLGNIESHWSRAAAAGNLAEVGAVEPFDVLSPSRPDPPSSRNTAPAPTFSTTTGCDSSSRHRVRSTTPAPVITTRRLRPSRSSTRCRNWFAHVENARRPHRRGRADMMAKSDAYSIAYDDYVRALKLDANDQPSLNGFTRTAVLTSRAQDALSWVKALAGESPGLAAQIATSKLLAAANLKTGSD